MKLTKTELCELVSNAVSIRDEIIAIDLDREIPTHIRFEREQRLAKLINIAESIINGEKIKIGD